MGDFSIFLDKFLNHSKKTGDINFDIDDNFDFDTTSEEDFVESNPGNAYVAGYILKKLNLSSDCVECQKLLSDNITPQHLFVSFKEHDSNLKLKYASEELINILNIFDNKLFSFLTQHGSLSNLEHKLKENFVYLFQNLPNCKLHKPVNLVIDLATRLGIYKFVKKSKYSFNVSKGHKNNLKKFSAA